MKRDWDYKSVFLLLGIFGLALWLRLDAINWALPFRLHPDEWKYITGGAKCHWGEWNPKYFRNPPGFSYLNALWFPFWLRCSYLVEVPNWLLPDTITLSPSTEVRTEFLHRPYNLVLGGRVLSAGLGALTAIAIFFAVIEFSSPAAAVITALLTAVSFANVRESHFAVNDPATTFLITLVLWMSFRAQREGHKKLFYSAAFLSGVAVAFKYNAVAVTAAILLTQAIRLISYRLKKPIENQTLMQNGIELAIAAGLAGLGFILICPFPILDPSTFQDEMKLLSRAAATGWAGQEKIGSGILFFKSYLISEGMASLLFFPVGLMVLSKKRNWEPFVFPAVYLIMIVIHPLYFMRFALPVLPWFAWITVEGILFCLSYFSGKKRWVVGMLLVSGCLIEPLLKDLQSNTLLKQTDTRIECLRWFKSEELSRQLMAADQYAFPLPYRGALEPLSSGWDDRIASIDRLPSARLSQLKNIKNAQVGWIGISAFAAFPGYLDEPYPNRRESLIRFAGTTEPIKLFSPLKEKWEPQAANVEDTYSPVTELWKRTHPGPVIEIYRVAENNAIRASCIIQLFLPQRLGEVRWGLT